MRYMLFGFGFGITVAQAQTWSRLPDFPGTARDDASAFTIGNTVFVGTGREVSFGLTNDWYAFDMLGQSWTPIATLPASGRQYCSAFSDVTYGYLFGGVDADGPLNELWRYDPLLDEWAEMSPLPAAGRFATVAFNNGMVCTGLLNGDIATNECWQYNPNGDTWTLRASVPGPARHRASGSGAIPQVIGGADAAGNALSDSYRYDPTTAVWAPISILPAPRLGADAVYDLGMDMTYIVGGASSPTALHADAWTHSGNDWDPIMPFAGGPRRGGVIGFGTPETPSLRQVYYGTGVDAIQRYSDWWVYTDVVEGMSDWGHIRLNTYPNPSTGLIRIERPHQAMLQYKVNDMVGRTVTSGMLLPEQELDLSNLDPGDYTVRISDGANHYSARTSIIRP